jgi:hypothetical protein
MTFTPPNLDSGGTDWQLNGAAAYDGTHKVKLLPTDSYDGAGSVIWKTAHDPDGLRLEWTYETSNTDGAYGRAILLADASTEDETVLGQNSQAIGAAGIDALSFQNFEWLNRIRVIQGVHGLSYYGGSEVMSQEYYTHFGGAPPNPVVCSLAIDHVSGSTYRCVFVIDGWVAIDDNFTLPSSVFIGFSSGGNSYRGDACWVSDLTTGPEPPVHHYGSATFTMSSIFGGPGSTTAYVEGRASFDMQAFFTAHGAVKPTAKATFNMEAFFPNAGDAEGAAYVTANSDQAVQIAFVSTGDFDRRYQINREIDLTKVKIRTYMNIEVDFEQPAIIEGKPYSPKYWAIYSSTSSANPSGLHIIPEPDPPVYHVTPKPGNDNAADSWVWKASDLAIQSTLETWPEHGGDGPSWHSKNGYQPEVRNHVVFGTHGKYHTHDKTVYFDYRDCAHMWIDLGKNFSKDFTWVFCGIILSYPTARYGHYILDHGYNTPRVHPLPQSEATAHILGDGSYRAAMLYQRTSSLQGSHTNGDLAASGRHIRIQNNYHPSPRMMYSIWNNGASDNKGKIGTMGRRYKKSKSGTIDHHTMRKFVMGRRFNKVSTALASHMVMFEIRFFPKALNKYELEHTYRNLASNYKFDKYPT